MAAATHNIPAEVVPYDATTARRGVIRGGVRRGRGRGKAPWQDSSHEVDPLDPTQPQYWQQGLADAARQYANSNKVSMMCDVIKRQCWSADTWLLSWPSRRTAPRFPSADSGASALLAPETPSYVARPRVARRACRPRQHGRGACLVEVTFYCI